MASDAENFSAVEKELFSLSSDTPTDTSAPGTKAPQPPEPVAEERKEKRKQKPHWSLRFLLAILSFVLSLALTVSLTATALVLDLRQLTRGDSLRNLLSTVLTPQEGQSGTVPMPGAAELSAEDIRQVTSQVDTGEIVSQIGELVDTNQIFTAVFDAVTEEFSEEINITQEQALELFHQSTLPELLAEKLAACAGDVLNGTNTASITREEILAFINDNAGIIQNVFGVDVNQELEQKVLDFAEEMKLETLLRDYVVESINQLSLGDSGMTVEALLSDLQKYTSTTALWLLIGMDVLLAALLYLSSWLRLGVALRRISVPLLIVGATLSVPVILIKSLLGSVLVDTLLAPVEPVHYTILILGVAFLIGGIIAGAVKKNAA